MGTNSPEALYPEEQPEDTRPLTEFRFNLQKIEFSRQDLKWQAEALDHRINELAKKCPLGDAMVLQPILAISHNPVELKRLGQALIAVSEMIGEQDKVKKKISVLELVDEDPMFFPWAFGDLEPSDEAIEDFIKNDPKATNMDVTDEQ